jgi:hypothetical protein
MIIIIITTPVTVLQPALATTNASFGIKLSPHPVFQDQTTTTSTIPIKQTHIRAAFSGNGY